MCPASVGGAVPVGCPRCCPIIVRVPTFPLTAEPPIDATSMKPLSQSNNTMKPTSTCNGCASCVQAAMNRIGFAHYVAEIPSGLEADFEAFKNAFNTAPRDPYAPKGGRNRYYGTGIFDPVNGELNLFSRDWYQQGTAYNPEEGGTRRKFAGLGALIRNPFLHALILEDLSRLPGLTPEFAGEFIQVGIHMIRMEARPGVPGVATPNRLHKDGEPATFIHLIARDGITGGETWIAKDGKGEQMLAKFTMTQPLETAVVNDDLVFHYVSPVEVEEEKQVGYRDVLLIDVTPMVRSYRCPFGNTAAAMTA